MTKLKKSSQARTEIQKRGDVPIRGPQIAPKGAHPWKERPCAVWKDTFGLVEPQINAEGVHRWPFDPACPVDVLFMTTDDSQRVRMNRHDYYEILYLCSGSGVCHIEDRLLPFNEGDLAIIGSTVVHRIECRSVSPLTIAALFFEPEFICCGEHSEGIEYLSPFLMQDEAFPHVLPANSGIPQQVLDGMLRIQEEALASTAVARLAVKTQLKMILMMLVKQYAGSVGTMETFRRQQHARERLRPLFQYTGANTGSVVPVGQAARLCGMSESHFMNFFKQVTGFSFVAYFNRVRIKRAQALLANTDESLFSISRRLGFADQSYFCAVFRKFAGMSPTAYRRWVRDEAEASHGRVRPRARIEIGSNSPPVVPAS